jgi:hypothetical protein
LAVAKRQASRGLAAADIAVFSKEFAGKLTIPSAGYAFVYGEK